MGAATGSVGVAATVAGVGRPAPGTVAAGCGAAIDAAAGVADTFGVDQLADEAAGAGGVANVVVAVAAGADAIGSGCVAVVVAMGASDPAAATGEPATG